MASFGDKADARFMRMALTQARKGLGRSSPNPAVGAVVVKDGQVVGKGYHAKAGTPHAEVHALAAAKEQARGATIYVTLEPCHHIGRTPPCTRAIMQAGIRRVVYGASDPNPQVLGGGGDYLASQGLEVKAGVLKEVCRDEHRFFFTHVTTGRPHVILKTAATLDGKTASRTGHSRWVTGEKSRAHVHRLRGWLDAICVGRGTALGDNPQLTCRAKGGRDPLRVVVDSTLKLSPQAKVINPKSSAGCVIACVHPAPETKKASLQAAGARILPLPSDQDGGVDLAALLDELGGMGVTSLLLEGGAGLAWGFLRAGLIDEVMYFFAPKLIGGSSAPPMIGGLGFERMDQALALEKPAIRRLGDDLLLTARVKRGEGPA